MSGIPKTFDSQRPLSAADDVLTNGQAKPQIDGLPSVADLVAALVRDRESMKILADAVAARISEQHAEAQRRQIRLLAGGEELQRWLTERGFSLTNGPDGNPSLTIAPGK